ncbi:MAG: hypothetical protein F4Y38_06140 [Gemmatimonadetes bacterium]|nr:hypothetical protein [Gemmatimonadota bacterium]MYG85496.1 hypothetical protein [Gemmatimonadota bacterium]MYJ88237.1 hypothetical protein [Gemmatimonadota bacterium]
MASVPSAHVSGVWAVAHETGAGVVAQQACTPPVGVAAGVGANAVMHDVPTAAVTARDGDDIERTSMRTVNRLVSLVSLVSLVCLVSLFMNGYSGESTAINT